MSLALGIVYAYFSMIKSPVRVEVYILLIVLPVKP